MIISTVDRAQNDALDILDRLADPPLKQIHKLVAQRAEMLIRHQYAERQAPEHGKSVYTGIKKVLYGEGAQPGTLTGATEAGITGIVENLGYLHTTARVMMTGQWPKSGTNKQARIPLSTIAELGGMNEGDIDLNNISGGSTSRAGGPGASVSLTAGGGLKIIWDKSLKDSGEFEDWDIPAQALQGKTYGEKAFFKQKFMYLSASDVNNILELVSNMFDNILGIYGGAFPEDYGAVLEGLRKRQEEFISPQFRVRVGDPHPSTISYAFPKGSTQPGIRGDVAGLIRKIYRQAIVDTEREIVMDAISLAVERFYGKYMRTK